jgi:hypothetical protein
MHMVKLRNGSEEAEPLVVTTSMSLRQLWESGIGGVLVLSDLVQICRNDPAYRPFGDNEKVLKDRALLQADGKPHDSIRNVVLSHFDGEGLGLTLIGSPIVE